ncbi:M23 family metallopeptidase [Novosphingobium sp. ST904]|uniref:M23 family metallopeptidase n=1 Tax=Novosphingobium sp. ST904 TaxID=1684385 RepID=UPI0006C86350|nr:M23 family metallopeptidase [Novosphingobium sp. ST904]TCM42942.1 murein DD-endopeptidase MepM/ murein hydrolase activator NlpD [Novosphingobium sp. ST904]
MTARKALGASLILAGVVAGGALLAWNGLVAQPIAPVAPAAAPGALTYGGELTQGGWMRGKAPAGTTALALNGQPVQVAPDGAWFAAFDRDAGTIATLTATLANGRRITQPVPVSPRAWQIENINIPRKPGGATEAFMAIRQPELDRINAARALHTDAQGWRQQFVWPAKGRISGRFGSQRVYRGEPGAYHSGLDIATGTSGTPFVAPADGVVILAAEKPFTLEGNLLMLDHGMGLNSAFLHCSEILVKQGDHVRQGQVIGRIGMSGRATGPHLHWSIKWNDARLDPILFTGAMN